MRTITENPSTDENLLGKLKRRWEELALCVVTTAIAGMIIFLLWPQPQAVLSVQALGPAKEITNVATDLPAENNIELSAISPGLGADGAITDKPARKKSHRHTRKKPGKPPVLNLNAANASQLQLLPGLGPKMAERIIQYRKANGAFASIEQIMEVKGIGPKKFEKLRPYLRI